MAAQEATPEAPPVAANQSETIVNDLTGGLFGVIGVLLVLLGAAGVSIHNSTPVRLLLSLSANLATLTTTPKDDQQIKQIADQQNLVTVETGGVKLLIARGDVVNVDGKQVYPPTLQ